VNDRENKAFLADRRLQDVITRRPYRLIFATISGAHLYGFPSPDSDYDLRGCHLLPVKEVIGLNHGRQTIEWSDDDNGLEIDLVTHGAGKFFGLLLKKNGYVLEQLYERLQGELEEGHAISSLADVATARPALDDLLVWLRMRTFDGSKP
jgi:predicted nucleotidyltransferase